MLPGGAGKRDRLTAKATHRVRRLECEAYMMDENSKRPKASRDIR